MEDRGWSQAFSELAASATQALVRLWKQDLVQVALAIGMFLALALPLLMVIVLLWYVDSTGWRPAGGFYKIGAGPCAPDVMVAGLPLLLGRCSRRRGTLGRSAREG